MNLDELMAVWQSQDTTGLQDVDKTLLHLALRADEAQLKKERRIERWVVYVAGGGMMAAMVLFLLIMIGSRERNEMTGWDYMVAVCGTVIALLLMGAMYVNCKRQVQREQLFGASLRDQLKLRISQLDDNATRSRWTLGLVLLAGVCPLAILILSWRINGKSVSDDGYLIVWLLLFPFYAVVTGIWEIRRQTQAMLPRKHQLEELLKEIDGQ